MADATTERNPLPDTSAGTAPGRGRLRGRRVLVVGGGQQVFDAATDPIGNGRATSLLCAREGAGVVVADRLLDSAEATVDAARADAPAGPVAAVRADVCDPGDIGAMVDRAAELLGGLDGVVYNVGIGVGALDLAGVDPAEWDRTFAVNVRGAALTARAAFPRMTSGGAMVLLSSVAAVRPSSRLVAYGASKAALAGLQPYLVTEGAATGIRVNTVMPGLVDTPNGRAAGAGRPDRAATAIPLGRMATGWDIGYAALFLLSDESAYVTGQTLTVDGGRTSV
ncbi:SDR family oxidoreductase [Pseudonocardia halophobica]|uniref:Oxidoreductase n=1 Tax=Pseudonocardia halophobica TaxID=29401 RepID=A0A9W6KYV6_9PSEU|nr:SDR family oxidoreductase [Pseudonocardia halophobica]GLL10637.1 oxidoreductase [Pseudonocardia halophobica]